MTPHVERLAALAPGIPSSNNPEWLREVIATAHRVVVEIEEWGPLEPAERAVIVAVVATCEVRIGELEEGQCG